MAERGFCMSKRGFSDSRSWGQGGFLRSSRKLRRRARHVGQRGSRPTAWRPPLGLSGDTRDSERAYGRARCGCAQIGTHSASCRRATAGRNRCLMPSALRPPASGASSAQLRGAARDGRQRGELGEQGAQAPFAHEDVARGRAGGQAGVRRPAPHCCDTRAPLSGWGIWGVIFSYVFF